MSKITAQSDLAEIAALVSDALERAGISAVLSGGAAVSIYSSAAYLSLDLDFITSARPEACVAMRVGGFKTLA